VEILRAKQLGFVVFVSRDTMSLILKLDSISDGSQWSDVTLLYSFPLFSISMSVFQPLTSLFVFVFYDEIKMVGLRDGTRAMVPK
jgi:hypothetical protein